MKKFALPLVALLAAALGISYSLNHRSSAPSLSQGQSQIEISGFIFPEALPLAGVELIDHNNKPFTEANFKDKWTLVYVGYTFCPDACPIALTTLSQVWSEIEHLQSKTAVTLVSIDPTRDTPEHLKNYIKYFNESFTAATGEPAALKSFADQVKAHYLVPEDKSDPNYLVDHSSTIILIDPDASVHAVFTSPQTVENLARDYSNIVSVYEGN